MTPFQVTWYQSSRLQVRPFCLGARHLHVHIAGFIMKPQVATHVIPSSDDERRSVVVGIHMHLHRIVAIHL